MPEASVSPLSNLSAKFHWRLKYELLQRERHFSHFHSHHGIWLGKKSQTVVD